MNIKRAINRVISEFVDLNYDAIADGDFEASLPVYSKDGKVVSGSITIGDESEVEAAFDKSLGIPVGVIHTHPEEAGAELSSWDEEFGQSTADNTGQSFFVGVVWFDVEQDSIAWDVREFRPSKKAYWHNRVQCLTR